jgi:hypothetical protein
MGHKTNGQTAPLDSRIAATLASAEVNKDELTALLKEADAALVEAQRTIEAETANALDIANPDPDAADELVRKAERTSARLTKAIPLLRNRLKAIELYEYRQALNEHFDYHEKERDSLAPELADLYLGFLEQITDWYRRYDANTAAISDLHARAAAIGENRRLLDAELVARGIDRYDAAHPRLRDNLKLPDFIRASVIAYPPDPMDQWNRYAAQANEALRQRMAEKFSLTTGPDWAAGRDRQIEQEESEFAKKDEELRAAEIKSKVEYEAKLQESERRRLGGTP